MARKSAIHERHHRHEMSVFRRLISSVRARMRAVTSSFRRRRDARMHPARHSAVMEMLQSRPAPKSVLVLCHANICRSPYLAAVLQAALPDIEVRSAGFIGGGRPVPEHSHTIASRRGLDLKGHRSRMLTHDTLASADLILVMDGRQADHLHRGFGVPLSKIVVVGDLDPQAGNARAIHDPWRQPLSVFESSFSRLDRCASSLAMILKSAR
jgi:protein-tyrosine phosphatase